MLAFVHELCSLLNINCLFKIIQDGYQYDNTYEHKDYFKGVAYQLIHTSVTITANRIKWPDIWKQIKCIPLSIHQENILQEHTAWIRTWSCHSNPLPYFFHKQISLWSVVWKYLEMLHNETCYLHCVWLKYSNHKSLKNAILLWREGKEERVDIVMYSLNVYIALH